MNEIVENFSRLLIKKIELNSINLIIAIIVQFAEHMWETDLNTAENAIDVLIISIIIVNG
jgi:hypothetical protein